MKIVREHIAEIFQVPFTNNTRNYRINATYPLSRLQYEDADKRKKKRLKKKKLKK